MIVRRLAARRLVRKGSTEPEPPRRRARRFFVWTVAAGGVAGAAAWLSLWPFGHFESIVRDVFGSGTVEVRADAVFPSVAPTQKVVNVYDPPTPTRRPPAAAPPPAGGGDDNGGGDGPGDD